MAFLGRFIGIRINHKESEAIRELLDKYCDKYFSTSHIVRCAIIKLLDAERKTEEDENRRNRN